jgi:phosphoribosyl 1,2-cyclic phosphodiesterase/anti-anti-sigma regulatory factor
MHPGVIVELLAFALRAKLRNLISTHHLGRQYLVRVKFWGVRGSIPTPMTSEQLGEKLFKALSGAGGIDLSSPAAIQAYIADLPPSVRALVGGNTTCVEIDTGSETIIIDCGSGMRALGNSLMAREFGRGQGVAHIFMTHFHWDHLQGFPFFTPAYVPGNRLIFYAVGQNPQTFLEHQQAAPLYFPIPTSVMGAHKEYVQLREGASVQIGRTLITNLSLYHPGTAYAYRFDDGESVFVFASDGEYQSLSEANLRRYVNFFTAADALAFDSQYSLRDVFMSKADWGHSSAIIGVDIAERAQVKRLITFHHDPVHSDEQIYAIADVARDYAQVNEIPADTEVIVGYEGLELFLGQPSGADALEVRQNGVITVALAGPLDAVAASQAGGRLQKLLSASPHASVLFDLTQVSNADSAGMRSLLEAAGAHPQARFAVLVPDPAVRRMFEQVAPDEQLYIVNSRAQAQSALSHPIHEHLANALIDDQHQLGRLWFADDQGLVYHGRRLHDQQPVIVRIVAGALDSAQRRHLLADWHAWANLWGPDRFPEPDPVESDNWAALICQLPDGMPLRQWLVSQPTRTERWLLAARLCQAVAAAHANHLIHGDLRPEHIIVAEQQVHLTRLALLPVPLGRPATAYQAPEQLRGQPATMRSDVYALGILLYRLLLDAHPFVADNEELQLSMQLYSQPQRPRTHWPEIPAPVEAFLLHLLALDPLDRPADAQAALQAFEALAAPA